MEPLDMTDAPNETVWLALGGVVGELKRRGVDRAVVELGARIAYACHDDEQLAAEVLELLERRTGGKR